MAIVATRIIALMLGLAGEPTGIPELPAFAVIAADEADVGDEAGARAFLSGVLRRGDRVRVLAVGRDGWLTIEPPAGSFGWIEASSLEEEQRGRTVRVGARRAVVRSAHPDAKLPGPPWLVVDRGTPVRPIERQPMIVGSRTWRAIEPPPGAVAYLRGDRVAWDSGIVPPSRRPEETRVAFLPAEEPPGPVPSEIGGELARIEASHRAIVRAPLEEWQLEPIRQRYETLLRHVTDSALGNTIRDRIAQANRQQDAAEAARTITAILTRSRRRDAALAQFRRRIALADSAHERPYDVEGLIQPSSRKVDGQKVFALIGPEGTTLAYLDMPPGLDPRPYVAHRVGVRGIVHYDENLRSRLISVRDLDTLDDVKEANQRDTARPGK